MELLRECQRLMGGHDMNFFDPEILHTIVCVLSAQSPDLSPASILSICAANCLPIDSAALMLVAMAHGTTTEGNMTRGQLYFETSAEIIKHFTGQATIHSCLTLFLQHVFALRIGTLNYAQGLNVQAIQQAHTLGLHRNTHGNAGMQLYLLIYMADQ